MQPWTIYTYHIISITAVERIKFSLPIVFRHELLTNNLSYYRTIIHVIFPTSRFSTLAFMLRQITFTFHLRLPLFMFSNNAEFSGMCRKRLRSLGFSDVPLLLLLQPLMFGGGNAPFWSGDIIRMITQITFSKLNFHHHHHPNFNKGIITYTPKITC